MDFAARESSVWKLQVAAAAMIVLAGCKPSGETPPPVPAVPEAAEVTATPVKLMTWEDLTSRPPREASTRIRWGEGATDIADLWLPEGAGPFPVVVLVHGGCWQKSIADLTLMNWMADGLRNKGWAVWNIEYRGVDEPGGGYPGTFLDVGAAIDALGLHADQFRLDLSRVTGLGHSAGGHLILWAAARSRLPDDSPVRVTDPLAFRGVVVSGGLADLEASRPVTAPGCLDAIHDTLTGPATAERPDPLADTSPARLFPIGVPFVSVNGADDRIAPPVLGEGLTVRALAKGDQASLIVVPDTGHVELVTPGTEAFEAQAQALAGFVGGRPNEQD